MVGDTRTVNISLTNALSLKRLGYPQTDDDEFWWYQNPWNPTDQQVAHIGCCEWGETARIAAAPDPLTALEWLEQKYPGLFWYRGQGWHSNPKRIKMWHATYYKEGWTVWHVEDVETADALIAAICEKLEEA